MRLCEVAFKSRLSLNAVRRGLSSLSGASRRLETGGPTEDDPALNASIKASFPLRESILYQFAFKMECFMWGRLSSLPAQTGKSAPREMLLS